MPLQELTPVEFCSDLLCDSVFSSSDTILACDRQTNTHTQPFNGLMSGTTRVGRYQKKKTFTHSHPSWSLDILYHPPPFTTIHGILFAQFMSLTVLSDNLFAGPLWSSSWPWTLNFKFYAFLHPIIIIFSQHMPIPTQPVLLQYQCYVIYITSITGNSKHWSCIRAPTSGPANSRL